MKTFPIRINHRIPTHSSCTNLMFYDLYQEGGPSDVALTVFLLFLPQAVLAIFSSLNLRSKSWESCWQETLQTVQQGQRSGRWQQGWFCYSMSAGEAHRAGWREELLPGGGVWSGLLHSQPDGVLRPHGVPVLHRECPSVQVSRSASTWNDRKLTGR